MKIFKIIFLFFLSLFNVALFFLSFSSIIFIIKELALYNLEFSRVWRSISYQSIYCINYILVLIVCIYLLINLFKQTNALNSVKYTYEEYKIKKDRKKALKQEKQKEILKQKLNELEKGD